MMRRCYLLVRELRGPEYRALVDYAVKVCDRGVLVDQHGPPLRPEAKAVLQALKPYLVSVTETREWPGWATLYWEVGVYTFRLVPESAEILKSAVDRLYAWRPGMLEGPAFLKRGGGPWFSNFADDENAAFFLSEVERDALLTELPTIPISGDCYGRHVRTVVRSAGRTNWRVLHQPKGGVYRLVIEHALGLCSHALLVDEGPLTESGKSVLDSVKPYVVEATVSSEWPGTRLLDGVEAMVYKFVLTRESSEILKGAVNRLYDWKPPWMPEDLCLLRADGSPWLVTEASGASAYFLLSHEEKESLVSRIPMLRLERLDEESG